MSARKIPFSCRYPIRYQLGGAEHTHLWGNISGRRDLSQILLSKVCCHSQLLWTAVPKWCWGRNFWYWWQKTSLSSLTVISQILLIYTDLCKISNFHLLLQRAIRSELLPAESHENDPVTFNGLQIRLRIFIFATVFRTWFWKSRQMHA